MGTEGGGQITGSEVRSPGSEVGDAGSEVRSPASGVGNGGSAEVKQAAAHGRMPGSGFRIIEKGVIEGGREGPGVRSPRSEVGSARITG